jgi:iron complex outermembrane receptor protein
MKAFLSWSAQFLATGFALGAAPNALAQDAQSSAVSSVEEIVVTARRREESLQNVPASIQVVGEQQINALNASSLADLNGAMPSVRVSQDGSLSIRGISSNTRNIGFEAGAAVYVDGVYQGRPAGNDQDLVDIERVEILRGPQGTLYGKNTTAGALSITTISSGETWRGRANLRLGDHNERSFAGYVAGPLTETVGVKFAVFRREQDGFQNNVVNGEDYGNADSLGGRAELRFSDVAGWDLSLRGDYVRDDTNGPYPEPVTGPFVVAGTDTIGEDLHRSNRVEGGGASLTAERDLGGGVLTSVTAARRLDTELIYDDDYGPLDLVWHHWEDAADQFSQEVRYASGTAGRLDYIVGAYYFDQVLDSFRPFSLFGDPLGFYNRVRVETQAYALFANADVEITGSLTLTTGLRYTVENKDLQFEQQGTPLFGYPDVPLSRDSFEDDDLSPTISLRYQVTPDIMAYMTVSQGFKSGGWNPDLTLQTATDGFQFGPEKNTNYELGLRTQLFDRQLTLNATIFHMDYDDLQVSQFISPTAGFVIRNAASAEIDGVELELLAHPTSWLDITTGAAYNEAKYQTFLSGKVSPPDYNGQTLTNAPKYSAYISGDINFPISSSWNVVLHGDYRYESAVWFTDDRVVLGGLETARDGADMLNARVGLESDRIEISLYAQNLTDERTLRSRVADILTQSFVLDTYSAPRQYGVRIGYSF